MIGRTLHMQCTARKKRCVAIPVSEFGTFRNTRYSCEPIDSAGNVVHERTQVWGFWGTVSSESILGMSCGDDHLDVVKASDQVPRSRFLSNWLEELLKQVVVERYGSLDKQ